MFLLFVRSDLFVSQLLDRGENVILHTRRQGAGFAVERGPMAVDGVEIGKSRHAQLLIENDQRQPKAQPRRALPPALRLAGAAGCWSGGGCGSCDSRRPNAGA
jgi:hypothetical protein